MRIEKIVVIGGKAYLGREICRLGHAVGHRIFSVDAPAAAPPARSFEAAFDTADEPWKHGITWVEADPSQPEQWRGILDGAYALVCSVGVPQQTLEHLATLAEQAGVRRFVLVSPYSATLHRSSSSPAPTAQVEPLISGRTFTPVILRPSLIGGAHGSPLEGLAVIDDGDGSAEPRTLGSDEVERHMAAGATIQPVERVALAALRAALESDIDGVLDADDIEHLGDAVFIQG